MPPIIAATCWPSSNSPPGGCGDDAGRLDAEHARKGDVRCEARVQLGAIDPERLDPDQHPAWARLRDWKLADPKCLGRPGGVQHDGAHGRRHVRSLWSIEVSSRET